MTESGNKYERLTDEEIISLIRTNDNEALDFLMAKYKWLVKQKALPYFLLGADREDVVQEGMIGLYKAIRDYSQDKADFFTFCQMCVVRQIQSAVKMAGRNKHLPLNSYISLYQTNNPTESPLPLIEELPQLDALTPEEIVIGQEERRAIENSMTKALSVFEMKVLSMYVSGLSYTQIADRLGKNEKAVDNALQRIRKKIHKILFEKNLTNKEEYANI